MTVFPARLAAPAPGWTTYADVVVVGSGIAGLTAALRVREAGIGSVMVVTKDHLSAGSTQWAQGGIAAAIGPGDTPEQHEVDTLVAGAGACDPAAVRALVTEGPDAVRELIEPGSWSAEEHYYLRTLAGVLVVRHTAATHRKIHKLLTELDVLEWPKPQTPAAPMGGGPPVVGQRGGLGTGLGGLGGGGVFSIRP